MYLLENIILSCSLYGVYAEWNQLSNEASDNLPSSQAVSLWTKSINTWNTSSYVYELQKLCSDCNECETEPKYIIVNNDHVTNVTYVNINSECLLQEALNINSYKTIKKWFEYIEQYKCETVYDDTYGFPKTVYDNYMGNTFEILCISFIKKQMTLNFDSNYCSKYANKFNELNVSSTTNGSFINCKSEVIEKDDCTEWLYVYITTTLSIILSILSILCFWLYYRQGINPATKGYKRSQNSDFVIENDDSDSDSPELHNGNIIQNKKQKKKNKLLGIDENKVIPKIKIKKNMQNKYGSIAQTDEDEKYDNPFDMDPDSERSDECHFVNNNKRNNDDENIQKRGDQFAGSQSDKTDDEEED